MFSFGCTAVPVTPVIVRGVLILYVSLTREELSQTLHLGPRLRNLIEVKHDADSDTAFFQVCWISFLLAL